MTTPPFSIKKQLILCLVLLLTFSSCEDESTSNNIIEEVETNSIETNDNILMAVKGKVFSVPSPIQTSFLINTIKVPYDQEILNPTTNTINYTTKHKRALNLGVYGADLGYVTLYNKPQDAISYLTSVKKLGDELGLNYVFDEKLLARFERNLSNQDSLLLLVSKAFKMSDNFLRNNKDNDVAVLVIAGGWLESIHFITKSIKVSTHQEIIRRLGEQKITLHNLIQILTPYKEKQEFSQLLEELMYLNQLFDKVEITYTYIRPTIDAKHSITTINSTTKVNISEETIKLISAKVEKIRNEVIN